MPPVLPLSLLMGLDPGVSAHRAGLCTVKAVAEVATSRSGRILWPFLKVSLWIAGLCRFRRDRPRDRSAALAIGMAWGAGRADLRAGCRGRRGLVPVAPDLASGCAAPRAFRSCHGSGCGLLPGGNDRLIRFGLPELSPHALPGRIAVIVGIALALTLLRRFGRPMPVIFCEADICRTTM